MSLEKGREGQWGNGGDGRTEGEVGRAEPGPGEPRE